MDDHFEADEASPMDLIVITPSAILSGAIVEAGPHYYSDQECGLWLFIEQTPDGPILAQYSILNYLDNSTH
jgi:hypothetical protein